VFGHGRVGEQQIAHADAVFGPGHNEAYIDVLWNTDLAGEIAALDVPTLVLQPTGESLISVEHARELAAAIKGSEFALVDGGYYPYQAVDGGGLLAMLDDFLGVSAAPGNGTSPARLNGAGLSHREREVLMLLTVGQSNAGIADALSISPRTIDRHIQNIYTKLNVHNRVEAANWARDHGVL
jgi:DNA-binding CsgD family transcriptional regulator